MNLFIKKSMSIRSIIDGVDKVGKAFSKYNSTIDNVITGVTYNNTTTTLTFSKLDGSYIEQVLTIPNIVTGLTYNQISILKNNNNLMVGFWYLLDYQTIHTIPYTTENHTGSTEQILILTDGVNSFSSQAKSITYNTTSGQYKDIIYYDFDDNICEDGITPRPGRITYRKDIIRNLEAWYDWREVTYNRYPLELSGYTAFNSSTYYNVGDMYSDGSNIYIAQFAHSGSTSSSILWYKVPTSLECVNPNGYLVLDQYNLPVKYNLPTSYKTFQNPLSSIDVTIKNNTNFKYNNIIVGSGFNSSYIDGYNITIRNSGNIDIINSNDIYILNGSGNNVINNSSFLNLINGSSTNFIKNTNNIYMFGSYNNNILNSTNLTFLGNTNFNIIVSCNKIYLDLNSENNNLYNVSSSFIGNNSSQNLINNNCSDVYIADSSSQNIIGNNSCNISLAIKKDFVKYNSSNTNYIGNSCKNISIPSGYNNFYCGNNENILIDSNQPVSSIGRTQIISLFLCNGVKNKDFNTTLTNQTYEKLRILIPTTIYKNYNTGDNTSNYKVFNMLDSNEDLWTLTTDSTGSIITPNKLL